MGSLLPLIAAVVLALLSIDGTGPAEVNLLSIAALLAAWFASGRALGTWLAGAVERSAHEPGPALERLRRGLSLHRSASLPAFAVILWMGGWSAVARDAGAAGGEIVSLLVALLPWPLLLFLSRASTWPAERRLGLQPLPFGRSLLQVVRVGSLIVVPVILLLGLHAAAGALVAADLPPFRQGADLAARYDFVSGLLLLAGLALVLSFFPVVAMRLLGARPMRDGPLRRRLEAYAARVGLGYRDLYVWETGGQIPNAAVLGVGRRLRCVVFTDALLMRLDHEEVEAVFAHEAGHALHHHLPLFFLFTVGFSLALFAAMQLLPAQVLALLEARELLTFGILGGGMLLYFGLLFGFVSRRLEQQADVHGLLTVGLPEGEDPVAVLRDPSRHPFLRAVAAGEADPGGHPFVGGLEGIAETMGGMREITGWRHFSIADRVEFLRRFAAEPAVRAEYRARMRLLLGMLGALLLLFALAGALDLPRQFRGPDPAAALGRAHAVLRLGRVAEARDWIEAGVRGGEARGRVLAPGPVPLPQGGRALDLAILQLANSARDPRYGRGDRVRFREAEALARALAGRTGEAAAAAARAVESLPPDAAVPGAEVRALSALRAESLLVLAHCLAADGRPAAAAAARKEAAAAARIASDRALERAAGTP